jgi:hypothetical protein
MEQHATLTAIHHTFQIWFGKRPWIVIADPEVAKKLSSRLLQRPNLRYFSLPPPDQAYINAQGVLNLRLAQQRPLCRSQCIPMLPHSP